MRDASVGEALLLLNHQSVENDTPYKASHAIFIREGASTPYRGENTIPDVMFNRMLSLRAFDAEGMMVDADLATAAQISLTIERFFANPLVDHILAHNATRGCYSGRIDRL